MARPDAALNAIKELQTILDDEKDAIAGGTHLNLCNAALAVKRTPTRTTHSEVSNPTPG